MSLDRSAPRLLLVEDDPVSRSFLGEALAGLPAVVDLAQDIAQAVQLAAANPHALWLIDAHLPDGDGGDCLEALRELHDVPALAITAGASRAELDDLCSRGFLEVLLKPVSIALLQATVRRLLGERADSVREPRGGKLPVWDEARALAAIGGSRASLQALRKLFLGELPALRAQLVDARAADDIQSMQAVLHKLKAGCGFVGASRLAQAVLALSKEPMDADALSRFGFAADDALDAVQSQD
jgi:CheY-like chemotaxis protein